MLDNLRITIRELADDVDLLFGFCQVIFTDVLDMKRAPVKIVPKLQNFMQTQSRMNTLVTLTTFNDKPDLLKKVITGPR